MKSKSKELIDYSIVVPVCKLYDKNFQYLTKKNYATYNKKKDKWYCIYPNPFQKQKFRFYIEN